MAVVGKIALVTGAGVGIGKAVSLARAHHGRAVALAGRGREPLEAVADEIFGLGARALAVPADVADPASVPALFAQVRETFGPLDFLFNNSAGGAPPLPLEDLSFEQWKTVVDINVTGV